MHACMHVKHGSAHATDCSQIAKAAVSGKAICKQLMLVAQCKCMQIRKEKEKKRLRLSASI